MQEEKQIIFFISNCCFLDHNIIDKVVLWLNLLLFIIFSEIKDARASNSTRNPTICLKILVKCLKTFKYLTKKKQKWCRKYKQNKIGKKREASQYHSRTQAFPRVNTEASQYHPTWD